MSTSPFTLTIFVANGDPDGLRIVERSNWIGKALMFPRALYTNIRRRSEFNQTGVYLLSGAATDGEGDMLYIGEGDPVGPRLESHYANKDFWTHAVFFVAGPGHLNKAHVQYLEAKLVAQAAEAKRVRLDNGNKPAEPTLSEADRACMDVFLDNILGMLPVLAIHAFEKPSSLAKKDDALVLHCTASGANAKGTDTTQGFIVFAGSIAVARPAKSLIKYFPNRCKLRETLVANGVLVQDAAGLRFTEDYMFGSPSEASSIVSGCSSNGRHDWRDADGRTLKQIQEAEALGSATGLY